MWIIYLIIGSIIIDFLAESLTDNYIKIKEVMKKDRDNK